MATAGIWGSGRMDTTGSEGNGAVLLRRRRMEIRRIKMMTSGSASAEQPVSKRLRPVGGMYAPRGDEADEPRGCGESACECPNRDRGALCGLGFDSGGERLQQDDSNCARNRMSVCEVVSDLDGQAALSSLSAAWERPSGGVSGLGEGNECANNSSAIVGNHSSDRMSSGGDSNSSGQHLTEESDVSSTLTFVGGFQSTLGNDTVAVQQPSQVPAAESRSSEARQPSQALIAGVHSSGANQSSHTVGAGPRSPEEQVSSQTLANNSGTEDMATSTATETLTTGHVDNQTLDTACVYPQRTSPWQGPGDESTMANTLDSSAVAAADAGGSSLPSNCFASNDCPPHGMVSLCGRRREMEDAVVSKDCFVKLPCSKAGGCEAEGSEAIPLHYFGVYDGHGGSQAANFCAERLHQTLAEEVESCFVQGQNVDQNSDDWEAKWLTAMTQCFKRMDAEVGGFCLEEGECETNDNARCCPEPIAPETVGTTAIVAVVGACQIIVGNCGDSRAVLSRGGVAIPLSVDHKPEREDEMTRVEAAGGRVIYWNGYRVLGVLAMSRAIGDRYLKPYVIAEPEVKCVKRAEDDECLILASDGLWDVMSNEVVCDIARRALNCRRNGQPPDASLGSSSDEESPAAQAAALLVKLALAKGSSDNISVVVVDLKVSRNR